MKLDGGWEACGTSLAWFRSHRSRDAVSRHCARRAEAEEGKNGGDIRAEMLSDAHTAKQTAFGRVGDQALALEK